MAKYVRTGRAGVHTEPCKSGFSDSHNLRRANIVDGIPVNPNTTIRYNLTQNNSYWMADDVPSLLQHERKIRLDYKTVNGRELPMKGKTASTPIRESILNLPNNTSSTTEYVMSFISKVESEFGVRCLRWFIHRDEEYVDPDTGEKHFNCHAHIIWDWYNWEEHRTFKLGKAAMSRWQDLAAEATGMQRGIAAEKTGADSVSVAEFKAMQERERVKELNAKNRALKDEIELNQAESKTLKEKCHKLDNRRLQLDAAISHSNEILAAATKSVKTPTKGAFGYKTSEVDEYIEKTRASDIVKVRSAVAKDYSLEMQALKEELRRLQEVEKEYLEVKESPGKLEQLHKLLWSKHKKEFEEKKELATFLFKTNGEIRSLYFEYFSICKQTNVELSEKYEQVNNMFAEAKEKYEQYKTARILSEKMRLFGAMLLIVDPYIGTGMMLLGYLARLCGSIEKAGAKDLRSRAMTIFEQLKARSTSYKEERRQFEMVVGVPERPKDIAFSPQKQ